MGMALMSLTVPVPVPEIGTPPVGAVFLDDTRSIGYGAPTLQEIVLSIQWY